jgi:8-oxo-dGTP diphosphatase
MIVAGIDGCKKGWIMIKSSNGNYSFGVYKNIFDMVADNEDLDRVLIDMPIGLSSKKNQRTVERKLRIELKNRASTVFNPPCREAVYQKDYDSARLKNIKIEGKSLSIQSYNITNKIKELDVLLAVNHKFEIIESHPELCFKYLNNGEVVLTKKSKKNGLEERKNILFRYDKKLKYLFNLAENNSLRKDVARDDIADAICLCLVNKLGNKNDLSFIEDDYKVDEKGIKMRIAYYNKFRG